MLLLFIVLLIEPSTPRRRLRLADLR